MIFHAPSVQDWPKTGFFCAFHSPFFRTLVLSCPLSPCTTFAAPAVLARERLSWVPRATCVVEGVSDAGRHAGRGALGVSTLRRSVAKAVVSTSGETKTHLWVLFFQTVT